jgi:hypothetical protein
VCGKPATAWAGGPEGRMAHGFASISGQIVLLCKGCFESEDHTALARKYFNAPDLKITQGGTYNDINELREIADAVKARGDKPTN